MRNQYSKLWTDVTGNGACKRPTTRYNLELAELDHFLRCLVAYSVPYCLLNQWRLVVNSTFNRNINPITDIVHENPVGNGVCKMTSILFRPQLVNDYITYIEYNRHGPDNTYLSNNKTNNESRGLIRRQKRGQWTVPAKPSHVMWEGVFHKKYFHHNSNMMEISFCIHPNSKRQIATNVCTWHGSCAVVSCADIFSKDGVTAKRICHAIVIVMKQALVK